MGGTTVIEKTNYGGYEGDYGGRGGGSVRGRANAGVTLGIIGTVLGAAALWSRGGIGSILSGGGTNGEVTLKGDNGSVTIGATDAQTMTVYIKNRLPPPACTSSCASQSITPCAEIPPIIKNKPTSKRMV